MIYLSFLNSLCKTIARKRARTLEKQFAARNFHSLSSHAHIDH